MFGGVKVRLSTRVGLLQEFSGTLQRVDGTRTFSNFTQNQMDFFLLSKSFLSNIHTSMDVFESNLCLVSCLRIFGKQTGRARN